MAGISSAKELVNIVVGLCGAGSPVDAELLIDPALDNVIITALDGGSCVGCRDDEADLIEIRILRACDGNKAKEVGNRAVIVLTLDSLESDVGDVKGTAYFSRPGRYFFLPLIFRKIKAPTMNTTSPIATIVFSSIIQRPPFSSS